MILMVQVKAKFAPRLLLVTVAISIALSANRAKAAPPQNTDSDWWSLTRRLDSNEGIKTQEREIAPSNFRIAGVDVDDDFFRHAAETLGKASVISRGDAATFRAQACYVFEKGANRVYLIFEQGEVNNPFYLFSDGPPWEGSEECAPADVSFSRLLTGSGVRLGQTPSELIKVFGRPSLRGKNEFIYMLARKRPPELLKSSTLNIRASATKSSTKITSTMTSLLRSMRNSPSEN